MNELEQIAMKQLESVTGYQNHDGGCNHKQHHPVPGEPTLVICENCGAVFSSMEVKSYKNYETYLNLYVCIQQLKLLCAPNGCLLSNEEMDETLINVEKILRSYKSVKTQMHMHSYATKRRNNNDITVSHLL